VTKESRSTRKAASTSFGKNTAMKAVGIYKVIIPLFLSIILILVPTLASAHPGRTDSNGGHYCRTNCAKWGLKTGEYHYHNGGSKKKKSSKPAATSKPAKSDKKGDKKN
jgi:hypothetical protein